MISTYQQAMEYIEDKMKLGSVPGLDNIVELLGRMGNPQDKVRLLHIAGTNGKGSIFAFVQTALVLSGYRIGRYVSPTVLDYLERFQMSEDGQSRYMTRDEFIMILDYVAGIVASMERDGLPSPTAFEIETAVAYEYFVRQNVDYALVECGMGGRLDATNVTASTFISVMASISMDHMQFLGDTLTKIAYEKAGIIKPDSICISAPQQKEVEAVIRKRCRELNTELIIVDRKDIKYPEMNEQGMSFGYKDEEYRVSLIGEYQITNAAVAIEILNILNEQKNNGKLIDVKAGLACTVWPGRFTIKSKNPLVVIDGAHNEEAWKMLSITINKHFTNRRFVFIIGVLRDKEYTKMVELLSPLIRYAIAVTPDSPRALAREELIEVLKTHNVRCEGAIDAKDAYKKAYDKLETGFGDAVMVCGSLSFLKPYLEF